MSKKNVIDKMYKLMGENLKKEYKVYNKIVIKLILKANGRINLNNTPF